MPSSAGIMAISPAYMAWRFFVRLEVKSPSTTMPRTYSSLKTL